MSRLIVVGSIALCMLAVVGAASPAAGRTDGSALRCIPAEFKGATYVPRTLETTWLPVGARLGTGYLIRPRGLSECLREPRRVHRLKGIAPTAALSIGGSSRFLLVRLGIACDVGLGDGALVRCLRRISS
jgi:hypothetical protein